MNVDTTMRINTIFCVMYNEVSLLIDYISALLYIYIRPYNILFNYHVINHYYGKTIISVAYKNVLLLFNGIDSDRISSIITKSHE